jgi:ABC-type transport system involved in cytochrome c biogenesis permease subunit
VLDGSDPSPGWGGDALSMHVTPQNAVACIAFAAYLAASVLLAARRTAAGRAVYFAGFVAAAAAVALRWFQVGHAPMQNLYEVFLFMSALMFPLTWFCRRFLKASAESMDPLFGAMFLVPVCFVLDPAPARLPPALQSPLFVPHVLAYMLSYVVMAKAAIEAGCALRQMKDPAAWPEREQACGGMVCLGFPFMTLGLLLGAWWAKMAWGDYWSWDPKELWSLATWLIFAAYLHVRRVPDRSGFNTRFSLILVLVGAVAVVMTLLVVNLARLFAGLHSYAL